MYKNKSNTQKIFSMAYGLIGFAQPQYPSRRLNAMRGICTQGAYLHIDMVNYKEKKS